MSSKTRKEAKMKNDEFIELYRAIIPYRKVINDNHDTHYRTHQGNIDFLTTQYERIKANEVKTPGNFKIPDKNTINHSGFIEIRCEIWRPRNIRFDPQNYAKTFKAPIDMLVADGFIRDDSWQFVSSISYCGGGPDVWNTRPYRYDGDGLPDDLLKFWQDENIDLNDPMIRILVKGTMKNMENPKYRILICKRDKYIEAWMEMYKSDKKVWNDHMFDGINPALNRTPLKTETDNVCAVAYDGERPIGIFSMVITPSKTIGKQFVVHPDYQRKGIGTALLLALEGELKSRQLSWYYIGCSNASAKIERRLGAVSFFDDEFANFHKFNVDLTRPNFNDQYRQFVLNGNFTLENTTYNPD